MSMFNIVFFQYTHNTVYYFFKLIYYVIIMYDIFACTHIQSHTLVLCHRLKGAYVCVGMKNLLQQPLSNPSVTRNYSCNIL